MWTRELPRWYAAHGRHHLPWRHVDDPWPVLVSEVMLQQTPANRVLPRWERFLARWPSASACAAATLDDVLREWHGLGYPRRARALWLTASAVSATGWPTGEAALRQLPGVGVYTARALLAFSDLGGAPAAPPRDVNLNRVTARAAFGREPSSMPPRELDREVSAARPGSLSLRDYAYALFDVGVAHCRARPRCDGCPLASGCALLATGPAVPARAQRRPAPYQGSFRQLRGTVLQHTLSAPEATASELVDALAQSHGAAPERVLAALQSLAADGLVAGGHPALR